MTTAQARDIAKQWALEQVGIVPGLRGVFLAGSINHLSDSDPLPRESDVDIYLVVDDEQMPEVTQRKFEYRGVLLEPSYHPRSAFSSPGRVLENFIYAFHLSVPSVVFDPYDELAPIQKEVEKGYTELHWVEQRCQRIMDSALQVYIPEMVGASHPYQKTLAFLFTANCAIQLPLAATLKPPTVKKAMIFFRDLCEAYSADELYRSYLELLGSSSMDKPQVRDYLTRCTAAFNFVIPIRKTKFPLSHCASEDERTYLIDGSGFLIESGYFRDAIPWILMTWSVAANVMRNDGSQAAIAPYLNDYEDFLKDLGVTTETELQTKASKARAVMDRSMVLAQTILSSNPAIRR
jgi:hypothetical protein